MSDDQFEQIEEKIEEEMSHEGMDFEDTKVTHVENLFIISYLTKAIQDSLISRVSFFQYPLLLVDLPLAFAILIVNVERFLYVKVLGHILAHIQYDVSVLKGLVKSQAQGNILEGNTWGERAFEFIRKSLRFAWGLIVLMFILPVWPLIWVYNKVVQTLLIATIYYFLMFLDFGFPGGFLLYCFLFITVMFLVSSITVPFLFKLSVYFKALFSLEKKTWQQINKDAGMAFLQFYKKLQGGRMHSDDVKVRYEEGYQAEGGVYYMTLKLLHYFKDKMWKLKEKKVEAVVEKIQTTTVEMVDEYYVEKMSYQQALMSLSPKDLRRTMIALSVTLVFCMSLVYRGSNGEGVVGPILLSFVDQGMSQLLWVNQAGSGIGYYQHMVESYLILPNFLKYAGMGADTFLNIFFEGYYALYPVYLSFISQYYFVYFRVLIIGVFWGN
ncbi:MAG: hypothetical protein P1V18_03955 [Candidatus Gracilibacteria bacterium]|nr:hypothetical protein [Candidatus Gracilibacteria bacterium]